MTDPRTCPDCGADLAGRATICTSCGWDATTAVTTRPRTSIRAVLRAGGWRLVVYGGLVVLGFALFQRYATVGPGPDLPTTLRWIVVGDDGRAAELVTLHRAVEIGGAAARYAVVEAGPPSFEGDWAEPLEQYATMHVRGWMPMLFAGATTDLAPAGVRELYRVSSEDGWGRPYDVRTRLLPRGTKLEEDPQVAADLAARLRTSVYGRGRPDLRTSDWLRLELISSGRDGETGTDDDVVMTSYVPVGHTLNISRDPAALGREMERAYTLGRHYFRLEGSRYDLVDARLLAEARLDILR